MELKYVLTLNGIKKTDAVPKKILFQVLYISDYHKTIFR